MGSLNSQNGSTLTKIAGGQIGGGIYGGDKKIILRGGEAAACQRQEGGPGREGKSEGREGEGRAEEGGEGLRELRQGGSEDAEVQPLQVGSVVLSGLPAGRLEGSQEVVQEGGCEEEGRERGGVSGSGERECEREGGCKKGRSVERTCCSKFVNGRSEEGREREQGGSGEREGREEKR